MAAAHKGRFPTGEVVRYLIVGGLNTLIGYGTFAAAVFLLNRFGPAQIFGLSLTQTKIAMTASVITTPLNITVSYINYKFFVFRTRGNFLREWVKAFSVYGVSMLVGLVALSAATRSVQVLLHGYAPLGPGTPGYLAGGVMTLATTVISYFGHKKVTFGSSPTQAPDPTEHPIV